MGSFGLSLEADPLGRLEAVVRGEPTTEGELRKLWEAADGWARTLQAQIAGSERRLRLLDGEAAAGLAEVSRELRRVDALRPQLIAVRRLLTDLESRARELRAAWL